MNTCQITSPHDRLSEQFDPSTETGLVDMDSISED